MRIRAAEVRERAERLHRRQGACDLCPRNCRVDRLAGERGECGVGAKALLSAAVAHFGEEPPISGSRGAGTLFLGGCNLHCTYCQNHQISFLTRHDESPFQLDCEMLAAEILKLQQQGCHNIEFVTPTHVVPQMLFALALAVEGGLTLPVIYNSGGYDSVDVLRELDGVIDIYLPDLKYGDRAGAAALSHAPDYWDVARAAITEMVRQTGAPVLDDGGVLARGVVIRHLVLPNEMACSEQVLTFIASLSPRPALSLMAQYYPTAGCDHPLLQRPLSRAEYQRVCDLAIELSLDDGWLQDLAAHACYRPDFDASSPFSSTDL